MWGRSFLPIQTKIVNPFGLSYEHVTVRDRHPRLTENKQTGQSRDFVQRIFGSIVHRWPSYTVLGEGVSFSLDVQRWGKDVMVFPNISNLHKSVWVNFGRQNSRTLWTYTDPGRQVSILQILPQETTHRYFQPRIWGKPLFDPRRKNLGERRDDHPILRGLSWTRGYLLMTKKGHQISVSTHRLRETTA